MSTIEEIKRDFGYVDLAFVQGNPATYSKQSREEFKKLTMNYDSNPFFVLSGIDTYDFVNKEILKYPILVVSILNDKNNTPLYNFVEVVDCA